MNLVKTTFYTGISTAAKVVSFFIIAKILANYVGPKGFAVVGQFQNFIQLVLIFAGNMIQNGVVKYTSENKNNQEVFQNIVIAGFVICFVSSFVIGFCLIFLKTMLAEWLLQYPSASWIFLIFGISLLFYVLNTFITAILNGIKEIRLLTVINVLNSFITLLITYFLTKIFLLQGALLALILNQSLVFFFTLILIRKKELLKFRNFFGRIKLEYVKKLFSYGVMAVVTAIVFPCAQMLVRQYVVYKLSWTDAGYWQAITRISDGYLLLIQASLSVYYLPKLAELVDKKDISKEILNGYKLILPATIILSLIVYFFRLPIVLLLFGHAFLPTIQLFLFQLIGDVLKIGSFLLAYLMWAKALSKLFIFSEIFFNILWCFLSVVCVNLFGLKGTTIAFALTYFFYWLFMWYKLRDYLEVQP